MVGRAIHKTGYDAAREVIRWASTHWPFIDGRLLANGVDIRLMPADRFFNTITYLYLDETLTTKEDAEIRDKNRAAILKAYNSESTETHQYGRSNDEAGEEVELDPFGQPIGPRAPLPELPITEQNEFGYVGLEPPIGTID